MYWKTPLVFFTYTAKMFIALMIKVSFMRLHYFLQSFITEFYDINLISYNVKGIQNNHKRNNILKYL